MAYPQTLPPAEVASAPAARGFVIVDPSVGPGTASSGTTVIEHAADVAEGRAMALAQAARHGTDSPRIVAEGFSGGIYTAVVGSSAVSQAVRPEPVTGTSMPGPAAPSLVGRAPGRPSWMLLVAAEPSADGTAAWGGTSPWSRSWIAPARSRGIRVVPFVGDVDDRRILTPAMLADPDDPAVGPAALSVGRRFGAPAVAELLADGQGGVRVWVWRAGQDARTGDASATGGRDATLEVLALLATPGDADGPDAGVGDLRPSAAMPGVTGAEVDVEEHPELAPEGRFGFAVVLASQDPSQVVAVRRALDGLQGAAISSSVADEDGAVVSGSYDGDRDGLVAALARAGITVSRY